jgi:hypothetical protein
MKARNQPEDGEPHPENIVENLWLPNLPSIQRAQRGMRAFASRTWGDYHRFLGGKMLEPDEREVYRLRLQGASAFAVDQQVSIARHPTCMVTDRRVMVQDDRGHCMQIGRGDIQAVHLRRQDDPRTGPTYTVAIERAGTIGQDTLLYCQSQRECEAIVEAIG